MTEYFPPLNDLPQEYKADPLECRNCHLIYNMEDTFKVKPGYRYCAKCYNKMVEIGQVVPDFRTKDGTYVQLWEGNPFRERRLDPRDPMFDRMW